MDGKLPRGDIKGKEILAKLAGRPRTQTSKVGGEELD